MIKPMDSAKVQVLFVVTQRAGASDAEKIICQEVADWLSELLGEQQRKAAQRAQRQAQRQAANGK